MQPRGLMQSAKYNLLEDYHLLSYEVLDSTNEEAKRLAGGGAAHGAVIWTKKQTAGKGRMGREWISPEGNLYVSVLLSPECDLPLCSQLSFVAANAVVSTMEPIIPGEGETACKWPNDILYDGRKLGGILLESFTMLDNQGNDRQWVVVGIGINIDHYPDDVAFPATCLRETGVEIISAKIVLSRFVYNFIHHYDSWCEDGFDPVKKQWVESAYKLGFPIQARVGMEAYTGSFQGIDDLGRLLLQEADGTLRTISAGDVFFDEA